MRLPTGIPDEGRTTAPQPPQPTCISTTPEKAASRFAASGSRTRPGWTPAKAELAAETADNNPTVPGDSERGPGEGPAHAAGLMHAA